jgi:hypothetical protein
MTKGMQGKQTGHNMEELQLLDLAIWRLEKVIFPLLQNKNPRP